MNRDKSTMPPARMLIFCALLITLASACAAKQEKARKAVEEHLKNLGIREMTVDLFHPADKMPDKAYIAVTVTYNFATGDGSFQKERLGFILKQDGQNWAIEKSAGYTKESDRAEDALEGRKNKAGKAGSEK